MKRNLNQSQAVLNYMKTRRTAKLTSAEIAKGLGKTITAQQVSKCLNKFARRGMVTNDTKGMSTRGTPCYRWKLNPTKRS